MTKIGYVYIMTNVGNTVLYTGVTSNLEKRVSEHKLKIDPKSFAVKYNINKLVYYAELSNIDDAIQFEKKIKAGSRKSKIKLVDELNEEWEDLSANW